MPLNARLNISSVEQFILDEGSHSNNIYQLCLVWVEELGIYLLAGGVSYAPLKKVVLLYLSGREIRDIYKNLKQDDDACETICQKLTNYFRPHKNLTYECFRFKQALQNMGKCVTSYITRLKNLALHCEFENQDEEMKDTFVATCHDINLKYKLLKERGLDVSKTYSNR